MAKQVEAQIPEETKLWSFITLCQKPNEDARKKITEEINHPAISQVVESNLRNFRNLQNRRGKELLQDRELISCRTISQLAKPQFQLAK